MEDANGERRRVSALQLLTGLFVQSLVPCLGVALPKVPVLAKLGSKALQENDVECETSLTIAIHENRSLLSLMMECGSGHCRASQLP